MLNAEVLLYERKGTIAGNNTEPAHSAQRDQSGDGVPLDRGFRPDCLRPGSARHHRDRRQGDLLRRGDLRKSLPLLSRTREPEEGWDRKVAGDLTIMARSVRRDLRFDKPIIAAVNGACLAGGTELLGVLI